MLCYWQLFDDDHLLSHTLRKLSDDVRIYSNHVPRKIATPGSASKEAEKIIQRKAPTSFLKFACNNSLDQHCIEKKNFRELRSECKDCDDDEEKSVLKKHIKESEKMLTTLKTNLGF